tara:strand:- start:867 stop:995 length:129 start_codon:yes stop_codon:yes gene_type:complete
MKCPRCSQDQGGKDLRDKQWWFNCFACGFTCLMKHYRDEFKK